MSQSLVGMDLSDLREALGPDQPSFRAKQLYDAIYRGEAADLVNISTLPVRTREELAQRPAMGMPERASPYESTNCTRRYLLRLEDGRKVEPVLTPEVDRDTTRS